ncbi:MAG TPA: aldehyde ferredoxin oxidoreductase C-terminal domain-containing protein [Syntrophorhabdus sp.]|nr:aldehyde ferredoxin oxidoreductase C-terminal domain-containing protein [Syntrophorhabdus sp.]
MRRLLRVNLSTQQWAWEEMPNEYKNQGGHALLNMIICNEVPPTSDPLGPENKLIFAPGVLAGTTVANCNRLFVGGKSPLTGGIKEANSGGTAALLLARMGIAALIIEGKAEGLTKVLINKAGVLLEDAGDLKGLGNYDLIKKFKDYAGVISIGQAGERMNLSAGVAAFTKDLHPRMAARGGLGAVMGSKNLKAIVIDDTGVGRVELPEQVREEFKATAKVFNKGILSFPLMEGMRAFGTPILVGLVQSLCALPTKNFREGTFDGFNKISGEYMMELSQKRPNFKMQHRCTEGCLISCSNMVTDDQGNEIVCGIEFETIALLGSNCLIDDLDAIAMINRICNDVGADTMEVGCALAIAMDAGLLAWGDAAGAVAMSKEMAEGTEHGNMLANGAYYTGKKLGIERIPVVKKQALAGYDPRVLKGTGVTYSTSPQGADHTSGSCLPSPGTPYNHLSSENQHLMSQMLQRHNAAIDALGLCLFPMLAIIGNPELSGLLVKLTSMVLGEELAPSYLNDLGAGMLAMEKQYNLAAGFTKEDDRLPDYFSKEALPPMNTVFDVPEKDLDAVIL